MTTATELLDHLHDLGVELIRVAPDRLRVRDPQGAVTPELRAAIAVRKAELLAYLAPHPCVQCGRFLFPVPGVLCYWCRHAPTQGTAA